VVHIEKTQPGVFSASRLNRPRGLETKQALSERISAKEKETEKLLRDRDDSLARREAEISASHAAEAEAAGARAAQALEAAAELHREEMAALQAR